ncbi:MAG: DNA-directed RNA polymerase subunit beta, partial [Bacilli bacterium]
MSIRNIAKLNKLNNDRYDYSRFSGKLSLPNLVEIQTKSYEEFKEKGLDEVFKESFPISNYTDTLSIDYVSVRLGEPKHPLYECKAQDLTYCVPIYVTLRLNHKATGEIQEAEVYMSDFPLMTKSGTFIVNGAERVIVSQLVRSPGAYLSKDMKAGKYLYEADLIPGRGTWLQFESDNKDILSVRIDRQRKMHATILLRALGIESDEDFISLFGHNEALELTISKDEDLKIKSAKAALVEIFRKMKPGEPITEEGTVNFLVQKFFDPKRYDLGRAGRYKYIKKLGIYNRLANRILAENLVSADGEVRFKKGYTLTSEDVDALRDEDFFEKGAHLHVLKVNERLDNHGNVNIVKVYKNEKEKKICPIIGTDLNSTASHVTISDIVAVFSYFLNVMDGFGSTDDIDHLGNRRIRCVGELIQNQFRIGLGKMVKTVQQKMSISDLGNVKPKALINPRPLTASIREFFASSQLSQFMDQTNPLAELTNKRRLSALGPGGLTRDRASTEVRDVHVSHYGRICPIETPEGQNIG